jgi:hypothetical protein
MKTCNRILTGKDVTDAQVKYLKDIHNDKKAFVDKIAEMDFSDEELKLDNILTIYKVFTTNVIHYLANGKYSAVSKLWLTFLKDWRRVKICSKSTLTVCQ